MGRPIISGYQQRLDWMQMSYSEFASPGNNLIRQSRTLGIELELPLHYPGAAGQGHVSGSVRQLLIDLHQVEQCSAEAKLGLLQCVGCCVVDVENAAFDHVHRRAIRNGQDARNGAQSR